MRIGLFFQGDEESSARNILAALKQRNLSATAYRLGPGWENIDGEEITFNFSSISHFVLIPSPNSFRSRWLPFLGGFAMGGVKNFSILSGHGPIKVPPFLRTANVFTDMDDLGVYLEEETIIWSKTYRIEVARESLIALGIGINEANMAQRVAAGDLEAVENFLHIGYSPDTHDQGVNLLISATRNGHRKIIDLLLNHGADVNIISQDRGNTALMEAAVRGDETSVRKFFAHQANPDLQSKSGQTALMLAVGEGHKGVVNAILEHRPNIAIIDQLGMTAKKYAELFRHEEIIASIEEYAKTLINV